MERLHLTRRLDDRVVGGVAAGLGAALDLDANVVRCGFVVLSLASGLGIVLYAIAWVLMPAERGEAPPHRPRPGTSWRRTGAFAILVLGLVLFVRATGLWPGDIIVWPIAAAMVGLALLALRMPEELTAEAPPWSLVSRLPPDAAEAVVVLMGTRRGALGRIVAGVACIGAGIGAFVISVDSWRALWGGLAAAVAVIAGIALVVGPGVWRLVRALVIERRERIRSEGRADVAAHLHDSVLQTLALVQRRADDPREVVRLARLQERELRTWLLGGAAPGAAAGSTHDSIGAALDDLAANVELDHGVPVEVVRVRDCPVDGLQPLLLATREAIVNAARHSGAPSVAVYLEVETERATVFVRDRGKGFDPDAVAPDRGGISGSIVGRMSRAGGIARISSAPGDGTEVELSMPRAGA